jgi:glyoxylase-like metal-dependent hydrolase (beta-lactamase superfamily II)
MKSTEITPNLIQLTKWGMMNAYLVREDDGFTLVDTTMNAGDEILAASVKHGGVIRRIVLTHGHGDHVGSVDALHKTLGADVPVLLSATDIAIHAGQPVKAPAQKRGNWPKLETTPEALPAPGERVGSLEIIATPGHTPGHVSFLDTRDRSVIAGDALSSIGGLAVPNHVHPRFPLVYFASCDRAITVDSVERIKALDPAILAVGHGHALRAPGAALDQALATANKKRRA